MQLELRIEQDLKTAMLARDEQTVSVLRMVKTSLQYSKVASGSRDQELPDAAVEDILTKEVKKRQESAAMYEKGGSADKANAERAEVAIIQRYLPKQLSEDELTGIIDETIKDLVATDVSRMGQVIGAVKQRVGASADGSLVARLVKQRLES
jgi:uncharacterized protein YqeY